MDRLRLTSFFSHRTSTLTSSIKANVRDVISSGIYSRSQRERKLEITSLGVANDLLSSAELDRFSFVEDSLAELDEADLIQRKGLLGEIEQIRLMDTKSGINQKIKNQINPLSSSFNSLSEIREKQEQLRTYIEKIDEETNLGRQKGESISEFRKRQLTNLVESYYIATQYNFLRKYSQLLDKEYQSFLDNEDLLDTVGITAAVQQRYDYFTKGGSLKLYSLSQLQRSMSDTPSRRTGLIEDLRGRKSAADLFVIPTNPESSPEILLSRQYLDVSPGTKFRPGVGHANLSDIFALFYSTDHAGLFSSMFQMESDQALMIVGIADALAKAKQADVTVALQASVDTKEYGITATNLANRALNRLKTIGSSVLDLSGNPVVLPSSRALGAFEVDDDRLVERNKRLFREIRVAGFRRLEPSEAPENINPNQTDPILTFVSGSGFQYQYVYSHEKVFGALVNYRALSSTNLIGKDHKLKTDKAVYGVDASGLDSDKLVSLADRISKQLVFDVGPLEIPYGKGTLKFIQRVVKRIAITSANSTFSAEGNLNKPFEKGLQFNIGQFIDTQDFETGEYRVLLSKRQLQEANVLVQDSDAISNYIPTSLKLLVTRTLESQTTTLYNLLFTPLAGLSKANFEATALARRRTPNILINDDYLRTLAVTLESMEKANLNNASVRAFLTVNAFDLAIRDNKTGKFIGQAKYLDDLAQEFQKAGLVHQAQRIRENVLLAEFVGQKLRTLASRGELMFLVGGHKFDQRHNKKLKEFLGEDVYQKSVIQIGVQQHSKAGLFYDVKTGKFTQFLGSTNLTLAELAGVAANVSLINSNDPNVVSFRLGESKELEFISETGQVSRIVVDSNKRLLAGTYKKGEGLLEIDQSIEVPMFIRERSLAEMLSLIKDYGAIDLYDFLNQKADIQTTATRKTLSANAHEAINRYLESLDLFTRTIYHRRRERRIQQLRSLLELEDLVESIISSKENIQEKYIYSNFGKLAIRFDSELKDLSVTGQLGQEAIHRIANRVIPVLNRKGKSPANLLDSIKALVDTSINARLNRGITLTPNAAGTELLLIGEGKAARPFILRIEKGAEFRLGKRTYKENQAIFFSEAESAIALQYLLLGEQERILTETLLNPEAIDRFGNLNFGYIRNRFYAEFNRARRIILDTQSRPLVGERKQDIIPISVLEVRRENSLLRLSPAENVQPNDPTFRQSLFLAAERGSEGLFDLHGNKIIDVPITLVQQGARKSKNKILATVNDELKEGIGDTLTAKQIRGMSGFGGIYRSAALDLSGLPEQEVERRKEQQERLELEAQQFLVVGLKGGYKKILSFAQRAAHRTKRIIMEPINFTLDDGGRFIRIATVSPIVSDNEAILTDNLARGLEYNEKLTGIGMVYVSLDPSMNDYGFYSPYLTIGSQRYESAFIKDKLDIGLDTTSKSGQQFKEGYESVLSKHGLGLAGKNANPYEALIRLLAKAKNDLVENIEVRQLNADGVSTKSNRQISLFELAYKSTVVGEDLKIIKEGVELFVPKGAKKQEKYRKQFAIKAYSDYNLILPELGEYLPKLAFTPSGDEIRIKNPIVNAPGAIQLYTGVTRTEGSISASFVGIQSPLGRGVGNKGIAIAIVEEAFKAVGSNISTVFENMGGGTAEAFKFAAVLTHARRIYGNEIELAEIGGTLRISIPNTYQDLEQRIATVIERNQGKSRELAQAEAQKFLKTTEKNISEYMVRRVISPRMIKTNEAFLQHGAYLLRASRVDILPSQIEEYLNPNSNENSVQNIQNTIRDRVRRSLRAQIQSMVKDAATLSAVAIEKSIELEAIRRVESRPDALRMSTAQKRAAVSEISTNLQRTFTQIVENITQTKQLSFKEALQRLPELTPNQLIDIQDQAIGFQKKKLGPLGKTSYETVGGALMRYGTQAANDFMLGMKAITSSNIQVLKRLAGLPDEEFAKGIADIVRDTYQYMTEEGRVQLGELAKRTLAIQQRQLPKTTADLGLLILANLNIRQQIETNLELNRQAINQRLANIAFDKAGEVEGMFTDYMLNMYGFETENKLPSEIASVFNNIIRELGLNRLGFAFYADDENIDYSGSFPLGANSNIFTLSTYYSALDTSASRMHPMFGVFAKEKQLEAIRELAFTQNKFLERKSTEFLDVTATVKHPKLITPAARLQQIINALSLVNNPNELNQIREVLDRELNRYASAYTQALKEGMRVKDGTEEAILALESAKKVGTFRDLPGYNTRLAIGQIINSALNVSVFDIGPERVGEDKLEFARGRLIKIDKSQDTTYVLPDLTSLANLPGIVIGDKSIAQVGKLLSKHLRITEIYNKLEATKIRVNNSLTSISLADYLAGKTIVSNEIIEVDEETAQLVSELQVISLEFLEELENVLESKKTQKKGMGRMGSASGAMLIPVAMRFNEQDTAYVGELPYKKILGGDDFKGIKSIERQINLVRHLRNTLRQGIVGTFTTDFYDNIEDMLNRSLEAITKFSEGKDTLQDLQKAVKEVVQAELRLAFGTKSLNKKLVNKVTQRLYNLPIIFNADGSRNSLDLKAMFNYLKADIRKSIQKIPELKRELEKVGLDYDKIAYGLLNRLARTNIGTPYTEIVANIEANKVSLKKLDEVRERSILDLLGRTKLIYQSLSVDLPNGIQRPFKVVDGFKYITSGLINNISSSTLVHVLRTGSPEGTLAFIQELKPIQELNAKLAQAGLQQLDIEHNKTSAIISLMTLPFQQGDYDGDMASITIAANVAFIDRKIEKLSRTVESEIANLMGRGASREQAKQELRNLEVSSIHELDAFKRARKDLVDRFAPSTANFSLAQKNLLEAASVLVGYKVYTLGEAFASYEFTRDQMEFYETLLKNDKRIERLTITKKNRETSVLTGLTIKQALANDLLYDLNEIEKIEIVDSEGVAAAYTNEVLKGIFGMMGEQLPIHMSHLKAVTDIAKIFGTQLMGQLFDTTHHLFIYNTLLSGSRYTQEVAKVASLTQTIGRTSIKKRGESSIAKTVEDFILKFDLLKVEMEKELNEKRMQSRLEETNLISPEFAAGYQIYLRMTNYTGYMDYINYMYQLGEFKNKERVNNARALTLLANYGAELGLNYAYNSVAPMSSSSLMGVLEEIGYTYRASDVYLYFNRQDEVDTSAAIENKVISLTTDGTEINVRLSEALQDRNQKAIRFFSNIIYELNKRSVDPNETNYKRAVEGKLVSNLSPEDAGIRDALTVINHLTRDIKNSEAPSLGSSEHVRQRHVRTRQETLRDALLLREKLIKVGINKLEELETEVGSIDNQRRLELLNEFTAFYDEKFGESDISKSQVLQGLLFLGEQPRAGAYSLSGVYQAALGLNYANSLGAVNNLESFAPKILPLSTEQSIYNLSFVRYGLDELRSIQSELVLDRSVANQRVAGLVAEFNERIRRLNEVIEAIRFQTEEELRRHISSLVKPDDVPSVVKQVVQRGIQRITDVREEFKQQILTDIRGSLINSEVLSQLPLEANRKAESIIQEMGDKILGRTDKSRSLSDYASLVQTVADAFSSNTQLQQKVGTNLDDLRLAIADSLFANLPQLSEALSQTQRGFQVITRIKNNPAIATPILAQFETFSSRFRVAAAVAEKGANALTGLTSVMVEDVLNRLEQDYATQIQSILRGERPVAEVAKEIGLQEEVRARAMLSVAEGEGFYANIREFRRNVEPFLALQKKAAEQAVISRFNSQSNQEIGKVQGLTQPSDLGQIRAEVKREMEKIRTRLAELGTIGVGQARTVDYQTLNTERLRQQDEKTSTKIASLYAGLSAFAGLVYTGTVMSDLALEQGVSEVFRGAVFGGIQMGLMQSGGLSFGHLISSSIKQISQSNLPANVKARYYASTFVNSIVANALGDVLQDEVVLRLTQNLNQMSIRAQRATSQFAFASGLALNIGLGVIASAITHGILANLDDLQRQLDLSKARSTVSEVIKADVEAANARIRSMQMQAGRRVKEEEEQVDEFEELVEDMSQSVIVATGADGVGFVSSIATPDVGVKSVYSDLTRYGTLEETQLQTQYQSELIPIQLGSDPTSEVVLNFISTGDGLNFSNIEVVF